MELLQHQMGALEIPVLLCYFTVEFMEQFQTDLNLKWNKNRLNIRKQGICILIKHSLVCEIMFERTYF